MVVKLRIANYVLIPTLATKWARNMLKIKFSGIVYIRDIVNIAEIAFAKSRHYPKSKK